MHDIDTLDSAITFSVCLPSKISTSTSVGSSSTALVIIKHRIMAKQHLMSFLQPRFLQNKSIQPLGFKLYDLYSGVTSTQSLGYPHCTLILHNFQESSYLFRVGLNLDVFILPSPDLNLAKTRSTYHRVLFLVPVGDWLGSESLRLFPELT